MKLRDNYGNVYDIKPNLNSNPSLLFKKQKDKIILFHNYRIYIIERIEEGFVQGEITSSGEILAPITGKINKIAVKEGDVVREGDVLITIESMKMEIIITSPKDATIEKVMCKEGDVIGQGKLLLRLKFLL